MSDKELFPGWRYDPETGQGRIFNKPSEVPEGWTREPYVNGERPSAPPSEPEPAANPNKGLAKELGVTKKELIEVLTEAGVEFDKDAKVDDLAALYKAELEKSDKDDDDSE